MRGMLPPESMGAKFPECVCVCVCVCVWIINLKTAVLV